MDQQVNGKIVYVKSTESISQLLAEVQSRSDDFCGLAPHEIAQIADESKVIRLKKGQYIAKQGEQVRALASTHLAPIAIALAQKHTCRVPADKAMA
eukprot:6221078-Pyramimonas_sp.AAC.1